VRAFGELVAPLARSTGPLTRFTLVRHPEFLELRHGRKHRSLMSTDLQARPDIVEPLTGPLPLRVLVTAQAFGFGPAAAMAQVFDHLRPRVRYLAFAGAGHTCDLHVNLHYDAVHRLPDVGTPEAFGRLCAEHDAALVSCDVPAGEAARAAGIPFGFYDPIPWFWPEWPSVAESADVYMCQDFFGVRQRVDDAGRKNVVVIPPMLPSLSQPAAKRGGHVLVNLGGILNPLHAQETSVSYARLVMTIAPAAARLYSDVHVTTSQMIAGHMQHDTPAVRTIPPRQVQHLLRTSELAAMTPGLGNIYEAAALAKRVFWLPPANASQGQQLVILRQRGLAPFAADWHEILPGRAPIDYWMPDPIVAEDIADAIHDAWKDPAAVERLRARFFQAHREPVTPNPLHALLDRFGAGGDRHVAEIFVKRVLTPLALSDRDHSKGTAR